MNFSDIRTYFQDRIALVDSGLTQNEQDPANVEGVFSYEGDRFYKLVFGPAQATNTQGNSYGYEVQCNLILYSLSTRDELASYDALYEKATLVRESIQHPCFVKSSLADFTDILATSITPSVEDSDDKLFSMDIEFTLRNDYFYN